MSILAEIKKNSFRVKEIARRYNASSVRVFGSVAREEETEVSDIDLLVNFLPGASLLDQVSLSEELSDFFHCHVDVVSERALNRHIANNVLKESVKI